MRKTILLAAVLGSLPFCAITAKAGAFSLGDLVVVQVGDGTAALTGNATAASLVEFNPVTANQLSPVQTINLPTALSGLNQPLTLSGSASSEGFLTLSTDGRYLTMAGYAAIPGATTPQTQTPAAVNRVIARIDMNGNIDTTTALNDAYSGSNIRGAVSTDGNTFWLSGNAGGGLGATAATRVAAFGGTTSTQLHASTTNIRVVNIFNGQVYADSGSAGFTGIGTVGTGEPTTSGQTFTLLPGFPTSGTHSPYDFWFKDANTVYVADDGAVAAGGGIQKWTLNAGTWTLQYTLLNNGTTTTSVRGLAGTVDGSGNAVLFGTTGSALISVTDSGAGALATTLATAAANEAFRGVEWIPQVPEPSALAFGGLGLAILAACRKWRR